MQSIITKEGDPKKSHTARSGYGAGQTGSSNNTSD
jgi:hypothetical protein